MPFLGDMALRAMIELAAMVRSFLDDLGNLRERVVKRLMEDENCAFRWREGLEENEKGERNGFLLLIGRFGRCTFREVK